MDIEMKFGITLAAIRYAVNEGERMVNEGVIATFSMSPFLQANSREELADCPQGINLCFRLPPRVRGLGKANQDLITIHHRGIPLHVAFGDKFNRIH